MSSKPLKPALLDLLDFAQAAQQTLITELNETEREALSTSVEKFLLAGQEFYSSHTFRGNLGRLLSVEIFYYNTHIEP